MSLAAVVILATGFRSDGGAPVASTQLGGLSAVGHLLRALASVRRLRDPQREIFIVVNETDVPLFVGPTGLLAQLPGDVMLPASQIISNGCTSKDAWNGEVYDLQVALRTIGVSPTGHVLALSHTLTFGPGYSLQRVVEHSMLRAKDAVGYTTLTASDLALMGSDNHTAVMPADVGPLPPLRALVENSTCFEGDDVAEPLLLLRPVTLPAVMASTAADLQGLASELLAAAGSSGDSLCGVDLQAGRLRLTSATALEYGHKYVLYLNANPAATLGDAAAALWDGVPATPQQLETATRTFNSLHYGADMTGKSSPTGHYYTLPSTFYMTQTRRQYAAIMR